MALKSFGRGTSEFEVPGVGSSAGGSSGGAGGGLSAFIDQGSEFEGKLSFRDTVRIDGRFRGEIASENTLIVGESGEIHATIRSNTVIVSGLVEGDIIAARKVVLHKTARVHGNLETPSLVVEEGAAMDGQVKMPGSEGKGGLKAIPGGARKQPDASPAPKATTTTDAGSEG
jgi:cytoskeletal protein CcmA (bactofilin family)